MAILQVTSREFREKQRRFFDLADQGERIVINRGNKQSYLLTPIDNTDYYFTPDMLEKVDQSLQEVKAGKLTKLTDQLREDLFGE